DRGEDRRLDMERPTGDRKAFAAALEEEAADQGEANAGQLGKERLEERNLALSQRLHQELRRDRLLLLEIVGQLHRLALPAILRPAREVDDRSLERVVELGRVDREIGKDVLAQRGRDPPVHAAGEVGTEIGAAEQRILVGVDALRLLD